MYGNGLSTSRRAVVVAATLAAIGVRALAAAATGCERTEVLRRAEAELAAGDPASAVADFDRASMMLHAPDAEMGLVRAYMQGGEYRRALAFGAHAAGAHLESASAAALYAWLLRIGGQQAVSDRVFREALARAPSDPILAALRNAFATSRPVAGAALLDPPHRMAPRASLRFGDSGLPDAARVACSGVAFDGGRRAWVPASVLQPSRPWRFWVRNGLGDTREATLEIDDDGGMALLRISQALPTSGFDVVAPRAPFAGSPGYVAEYATSEHGGAAWPWLRIGFFGTLSGDGGLRQLGIDVGEGPHGGPILDSTGRLVGMALAGREGRAVLKPFAVPAGASDDALPEPKVEASGIAMPPRVLLADEAYERMLRIALQVLVDDRS